MRPRPLDSKTKQLLQHRAQLQRSDPSWPEQLLWQALRSGQLGVPFRRQVVLGRYIVDFVAPQAKLVVEVDGRCHERRRASDARRSGQLGVPFRRQYPIGRLVADFVAVQARLVVEVDGRCHERRRASDARRDRKLARLGYRVLRPKAALVLKQLPVAVALVRQALGE